jgi:hypothetical protein
MSKTRGAFTRTTILLTAAALLVTLVAGSTHVSSLTRAASAATNTPTTLFSDGFESGNFSAWSVVKTGANGVATVQSSVVTSGSLAAQLSETSTAGSFAYANATLAAAQTDLTASGAFDVTVEGNSNSNVRLFRLFDGSGSQVASVYRQNLSGQLGVQYGGALFGTSGKIALNVWQTVALHVIVAGRGASTVQVSLNGTQVYQATTASLGTAGVLTAQIGNSTASQPSAVYVDNVALTTSAPASTPTPTSTPIPSTSTPTPTATPTSASDPVVMAAGDIACDSTDASFNGGKGTAQACQQLATSSELTNTAAVLPLGDSQYYAATLSQFQQVYNPTWGRKKPSSHPTAGNHEYVTAGAAGYYTYFGSAASPQDAGCTANCKGYYSYNLGTWHIVVLNSECTRVGGGCQAGSPQEQWLQADLAAHPTMCTLAYWHRPLFSSGASLGDVAVHDLWVDLYNAHADLVLNGHDHDYERFAPQDPAGRADPTNGITEVIVGTGGNSHFSFNATAAHSVVRNNSTYGVLKLTLHPTSFDWQFLPDAQSGNGTFTEAGSQRCH